MEQLEPSIRYCLHKIGESNLQTSELVHIGEMEGPALDLFKAKLEVSHLFQVLATVCLLDLVIAPLWPPLYYKVVLVQELSPG